MGVEMVTITVPVPVLERARAAMAAIEEYRKDVDTTDVLVWAYARGDVGMDAAAQLGALLTVIDISLSLPGGGE